jgi:hypothetical protein
VDLGVVREQQAGREAWIGKLRRDLGRGVGGTLGQRLPVGDGRPGRFDVDVEFDQLFPS